VSIYPGTKASTVFRVGTLSSSDSGSPVRTVGGCLNATGSRPSDSLATAVSILYPVFCSGSHGGTRLLCAVTAMSIAKHRNPHSGVQANPSSAATMSPKKNLQSDPS
jgi:hypothetical protein